MKIFSNVTFSIGNYFLLQQFQPTEFSWILWEFTRKEMGIKYQDKSN